MAIVNLTTIKNWFRTGLKPTQAQFWDTWDSFRHKNDKVPVADIEGIDGILNSKADKTVVNNHFTEENAHATLFQAKEDKTQKGAPNGYAPLDEFTKLAAQYLNIVNDLVTGGATALLSAEQGKVLQTQVNAINTLLTSDNVNLDTVQELVDAIETVQLSLSTILVNDLTTGGTTKALTAEMGKSLKGFVDALDIAKEAMVNKSQDIETDKNSTTKYGSVKAVYDWAVGKFKTWFLVINTQAGITYTFGANDYKNRTVFTSSNPVALTVPTNAVTPFAIGAKIEYTQQGDGIVTLGGAGITFVTNLSLAMVKGETRILTKIATDTWTVQGNRKIRIYDSGVGMSFGGGVFFGGYEFLIPNFGNNTIYLGVTDGSQNPRAYIVHETASGVQNVRLGSAYSGGTTTANWILENGRLIIGTGIDNGDLVQIGGTVSAEIYRASSLQVFVDNAAVVGLGVGTFYRTPDGTVKVKY